jgi:hypothetical protein
MNKSISKQEKIKQSEQMVFDFELTYSSHNMGMHWKITMTDYSIDFYPTTHSWYDPSTGKRGKGIKEFLEYIGKTIPEKNTKNIYLVRAEEKKTVYGVTIFKVEAENKIEAKQKVLWKDDSIEIIDCWDNCTEDIIYENQKDWEITKEN